MSVRVSTHDINWDGKNYILEWTHTDDSDGYVAITQACDDPEDDNCELETYDFKEVQGGGVQGGVNYKRSQV